MRWQVPATVALAVLLVATVTFHARGLSEAPRETGNLRGADFSNGTAFWLLIPAQPGDVVRIERWPFAGLPNMPLDLLVIEGVELEHVLAGGEPHVLYARMPPPPPQVSHQECYATGLCLGWVSADDNPEPAPLEVRRSQPKWLPPLPSDRGGDGVAALWINRSYDFAKEVPWRQPSDEFVLEGGAQAFDPRWFDRTGPLLWLEAVLAVAATVGLVASWLPFRRKLPAASSLDSLLYQYVRRLQAAFLLVAALVVTSGWLGYLALRGLIGTAEGVHEGAWSAVARLAYGVAVLSVAATAASQAIKARRETARLDRLHEDLPV